LGAFADASGEGAAFSWTPPPHPEIKAPINAIAANRLIFPNVMVMIF